MFLFVCFVVIFYLVTRVRAIFKSTEMFVLLAGSVRVLFINGLLAVFSSFFFKLFTFLLQNIT